jgi:hypothetical protein
VAVGWDQGRCHGDDGHDGRHQLPMCFLFFFLFLSIIYLFLLALSYEEIGDPHGFLRIFLLIF